MTKVFMNPKPREAYRQKLEALSNDYEFVYEEDKDAEIAIGSIKPDKLKEFKNLKWFQSYAVGVDAYTVKGVLNDGVILTNAPYVHSREVAEHTFAAILSAVKKLYLYRDNQHRNIWKDEGMVKQYSDLKVCIVGFGDIGNTLAKMLKTLDMYVIGVKRTMSEKPEYLDELYLREDLEKAISDVDVVVSILPGSGENVHLFTIDTFRKMRKDAIFVNVGRGNLYDEETLIQVLEEKPVAAVVADVFEKEPLDPSSRLWNYDNLIITPHCAGGYHLDSAYASFIDLCIENLKRYKEGRSLLNVVEERFE